MRTTVPTLIAVAMTGCAHEEWYREIDRAHGCLSAHVSVMVSGAGAAAGDSFACSVEDETGRMFYSQSGNIYPGGRPCTPAEQAEVGFGEVAMPECAR